MRLMALLATASTMASIPYYDGYGCDRVAPAKHLTHRTARTTDFGFYLASGTLWDADSSPMAIPVFECLQLPEYIP